MTKPTASAQALRTPDLSGAVTMECLGNVADLVRVGLWVCPPLVLYPELRELLQQETENFLRRLSRELAGIPSRG